MKNDLLAELARRELARRYYSEYLAYAYGESWIRTRLSAFLANKIQSFIETDTGHAYYDPDESIQFGTEIISVDASFKGDDSSDYVSIQVWGKITQDYYLRYCLNKRLNFPDTVEAIKTIYRLFPRARTVLIEKAANGPSIIQTLQREMFIMIVQSPARLAQL